MKRTSLVVRGLAIAVVLGSPFLPTRARLSQERSVIFAVDRSASISDDARAEASRYLRSAWEIAGSASLGAVAFDGRAEMIAPLGTSIAPEIGHGDDREASDLAAGIRLAAAALPRAGHRSVVVLTDGRPTRGDAEAEVSAAQQQGIRVDFVTLKSEANPATRLVSVKPRALHSAEGQPVVLDVEVSGKDYVNVEWTRDGVPLHPQHVAPNRDNNGELVEQTHTVSLVDQEPPPGSHVYEVRVQNMRNRYRRTAGGEPPEPPQAMLTAVNVEGKPQAIVFSGSGTVPPVLSAALKEGGLAVRPLPLDRMADPASYAGSDVVVLADVRVSAAENDDGALTRTAQSAIIDYVQQGGGLLVTGGVFGLAPEYAGTPLARILPVEIEDRGHVEDPPVALAIMLDRSGSMSAPVGNHTKIELAIEASLAAADTLRPTDHVAIASVDTQTHWDVALGPADRLPALRADVRSVHAGGGGIYVYTALRDAYAAIDREKQPIRHVILFSDTADSEEPGENCYAYDAIEMESCAKAGRTAEGIAREARAKGITTTVVGIGAEDAKDTEFLKTLAIAAGGRFYLTAEGSDLKRIFLSETRVLAQSNLREQKTTVAMTAPHPVVTGIDVNGLPPLGAYVETGRRAGAETPLVLTDQGRPLFATWRYGLGKTAALTTDLQEGWGKAWAGSTQAAQLLRQSVRHLLRQQSAHRADADVHVQGRNVEVAIGLPPDAPDNAAPQQVDLFAIDKSGTSKKLTATIEQRGPGQWVARARSSGEPIVVARARDAKGALMAEGVGREDRAAEVIGMGPDEHVIADLARVGDGRIDPPVTATLDRTPRPGAIREATWPWALVAASALVLIDLVLRRFRPSRRRSVLGARAPSALDYVPARKSNERSGAAATTEPLPAE